MANLIHLTTADLSDLADEKSDVLAFCHELERSDSYLLVTRYHLLEWATLAEDSQMRRVMLPETIGRMAFCGQTNSEIWKEMRLSVNCPALPGHLIQVMYNNELLMQYPPVRLINQNLLDERNYLIQFGEADFFARNGKRSQKGAPLNEKALPKYLKLNKKHGSDPSNSWNRIPKTVKAMERLAPYLKKLINKNTRDKLGQLGKNTLKTLESIEPIMNAKLLGVEPEEPLFQLYWDVRRRVRADHSEQGGLAEQIDLFELMYLPSVSIWSADKRVAPKVQQSIRSLDCIPNEWADRVIRCGKQGENALNALRRLPDGDRLAAGSQNTSEE